MGWCMGVLGNWAQTKELKPIMNALYILKLRNMTIL